VLVPWVTFSPTPDTVARGKVGVRSFLQKPGLAEMDINLPRSSLDDYVRASGAVEDLVKLTPWPCIETSRPDFVSEHCCAVLCVLCCDPALRKTRERRTSQAEETGTSESAVHLPSQEIANAALEHTSRPHLGNASFFLLTNLDGPRPWRYDQIVKPSKRKNLRRSINLRNHPQ